MRAELSKARDAANQISSRMSKVFEQNRMSQRRQEQTGQDRETGQEQESGQNRTHTQSREPGQPRGNWQRREAAQER